MRAISASIIVFYFGLSQFALADGPDKQSEKEIAAARTIIERDFKNVIQPKSFSKLKSLQILERYSHFDPKKEVPTDLLEESVLYFDQNKSKFPNQAYITVIDLGRRSNKQRFWLIDMTTGTVESFWTLHGWGSDRNDDGLAESFGNVVNSGKSSLGPIRTAEIYYGKFKRSVRLDGLASSNSRVRERAIVLHGFDYAYQRPVKQGLGWGCPALDWSVKDAVIDKVAEGSFMYIGVSKL